eukprot:g9264.t1
MSENQPHPWTCMPARQIVGYHLLFKCQACELCGYPFDFIPVYSKNAPHQLTVADWVGAICSSSWRVSHRVLRVLYAIGLWGFLLPLLTIMATRSIFGRARQLDAQDSQSTCN